jgi:hypothetical protein
VGFSRCDRHAPRRRRRPLAKIGAQPGPAGEVALGAQQSFRTLLKIARIAGAEGPVVHDEDGVLQRERPALEGIGRAGPRPWQVHPVEVTVMGQEDGGQRALHRARRPLEEDRHVARQRRAERGPGDRRQ